MGLVVCRERCAKLLRVSRKEDKIKICDPCSYYTKSVAIYCPCCGKKYRTRKHSREANRIRLFEKKRI